MGAENAIYIAISVITSAFVFNVGCILACRAFGVGMDKVAILLDPWFSIFKIKIKDSVMILGWVPFGGYVKVRGMEGKYRLKDGLLTKPRWAQVLIAGSGTMALLGLIFFSVYMMAPTMGKGFEILGSTIRAFFQLGVFQILFDDFSSLWRANMGQSSNKLFFLVSIVASLNAFSTLLNFSVTFHSKLLQRMLPFLFPLLTIFYILIVLRIIFNTSFLYLLYYIGSSLAIGAVYLAATYVFFRLIKETSPKSASTTTS